MATVVLLSECGSATIPRCMIREAVVAEKERRGWTWLRVSEASGVSYGRLNEWLNDKDRSINSENLEKLMKALGLRVSRGRPPKSRPSPSRKPRKGT